MKKILQRKFEAFDIMAQAFSDKVGSAFVKALFYLTTLLLPILGSEAHMPSSFLSISQQFSSSLLLYPLCSNLPSCSLIYYDYMNSSLHLRQILALFAEMRLWLSAGKSFLAYFSVELLQHRVDGLDMTTTAQKIAVIKNIIFPDSLKALEHFI